MAIAVVDTPDGGGGGGGWAVMGSTTLVGAATSVTVSALSLTPGKPIRILGKGATSNGAASAALQINGGSVGQYLHFWNEYGGYLFSNGNILHQNTTTANVDTEIKIECDEPGPGLFRHFSSTSISRTSTPIEQSSIAFATYADTSTAITSIGLLSGATMFDAGFVLSVEQEL